MCIAAATLGMGRHSSTLTVPQIAHANKIEIIGMCSAINFNAAVLTETCRTNILHYWDRSEQDFSRPILMAHCYSSMAKSHSCADKRFRDGHLHTLRDCRLRSMHSRGTCMESGGSRQMLE